MGGNIVDLNDFQYKDLKRLAMARNKKKIVGGDLLVRWWIDGDLKDLRDGDLSDSGGLRGKYLKGVYNMLWLINGAFVSFWIMEEDSRKEISFPPKK